MVHLTRSADSFRYVASFVTRCFVLMVAALIPTTATAQLLGDLFGTGPSASASATQSPIFDSDPFFGSGMDNFALAEGGSTWLRHIGGGGPGWQPFTSIGGSVPLFADNGALIIESQALVTNGGNAGGTVGFNRRFFVGDSLVGAGLWYDVIQSPNDDVFHQAAYSLEWFLDNNWTIRNNGYLPMGPRVRNVTSQSGMGTGGTVQFQNNNLIASGINSLRIDDAAMRGIDVEIARSVARWSGEAFVGYYNFQGKIGSDTNGIKGGVRGYVTPRLAGNVTISDDPLFGTNVYGGFTWFLGGTGGNAPSTIEDKLTIPVERNQQVVINRVSSGVSTASGPVILTSGGQPITITHVNSNAGGSNFGTFENPFSGLPPTQNTNIVYLHGDSTYNNQSYTLNPNQRFLGEGDGNIHQLFTDQLGPIVLPPGSGGVNRPVIQAANGQFALNSAANTEISNITIDNSGLGLRSGIFGDTGNLNVNRTFINDGFTGIDIIGGTGQFTFSDVTVTDSTNAGLSVNGGNAGITLDSLSSITQGTGGSAVRVNGGHSGIFNFGGNVNATNGTGLQFDNANGTYAFSGPVTLNGGDAGIDIIGNSNGVFTFSNTTITNPTGTALNVDGGSANVTYSGGSIAQSNNATTVNVQGGHTGTLNFGVDITATNGDGLQFDNADGTYNFNTMTGSTTLNGGDAGIDIVNGSAGTFTFADTSITNPTGTAFNVDGGSANVTYSGGSIAQANNASTVRVQGGHTGTLNFGVDITSTNGNGLQFDNADGTYNFNTMTGSTTLNGGDAGIDIIDSAGRFTFGPNTSITDPTGATFKVANLGTGGRIDYNGSISKATTGDVIEINTTAGGSAINFNTTGVNSIFSNGAGGIVISEANGDIAFTTPTTIIDPETGFLLTGISIFGFGASNGTISFADTIIQRPAAVGNTAVEINGHQGIVNFNNLDVTSIGRGAVGLSAFNSGVLNVTGTNTISTTGGAGVQLSQVNSINMTFDSITVNNSQDGFGSGSGVTIARVGGGTFDVTGTTTVHGALGVGGTGIRINESSGLFTFSDVDIDTTTLDGISVGSAAGNPGTVNINGGTVSNTVGDGVFARNAAGFNLNNTIFSGIGGFTTNLTGSTVSGSGNIAVPFSSNNGGGNTGTILFNGGADSAP